MVLKVAQFLRNLHREEEGFTLIELLIVIAIIAVIAAIAIPMVASRIDDARESADRANVRTLQGLADQYYIDNGHYPLCDTSMGEFKSWEAEGDWIQELVDKDYLHDEGVDNPYPGEDNGYILEVKTGGKTDSQIGEVTSSTSGRWEDAEKETGTN